MSLNDSIETKEYWRSEALVARNERDELRQRLAAVQEAARAEVGRLRAEVVGLQDSGRETFVRTLQGCLAEAEADRDRLRAALADTPENYHEVVEAWFAPAHLPTEEEAVWNCDKAAASVLSSIRARAGQP